MYRRRQILVASVAACSLAGCASDGTDDDDGSGDDEPDSDTDDANGGSGGGSLEEEYPDYYAIQESTQLVALSDIEASADSYSVTISGTVVNGSDTDYDYVQIEFGLYDDSGAKVGTALDNLSGLDAGQRWRFEAIGTADGASTWELEEMTAY